LAVRRNVRLSVGGQRHRPVGGHGRLAAGRLSALRRRGTAKTAPSHRCSRAKPSHSKSGAQSSGPSGMDRSRATNVPPASQGVRHLDPTRVFRHAPGAGPRCAAQCGQGSNTVATNILQVQSPISPASCGERWSALWRSTSRSPTRPAPGYVTVVTRGQTQRGRCPASNFSAGQTRRQRRIVLARCRHRAPCASTAPPRPT